MDDARQPPAKGTRDPRPPEVVAFERALNEGIDDLDAGRTVTREESRREIEQLLSSYEAKKKTTR